MSEQENTRGQGLSLLLKYAFRPVGRTFKYSFLGTFLVVLLLLAAMSVYVLFSDPNPSVRAFRGDELAIAIPALGAMSLFTAASAGLYVAVFLCHFIVIHRLVGWWWVFVLAAAAAGFVLGGDLGLSLVDSVEFNGFNSSGSGFAGARVGGPAALIFLPFILLVLFLSDPIGFIALFLAVLAAFALPFVGAVLGGGLSVPPVFLLTFRRMRRRMRRLLADDRGETPSPQTTPQTAPA